MGALIWFFGWLLAAQAAPLPAAPVNAGFDSYTAAGAPEGWTVTPDNPKSSYAVEAVDRRTGKALRVRLTAAMEESDRPGIVIFQNVDASAFRGKRVRLRASFRVEKAGSHIGMGIRVIRPAPKMAGFGDTMDDRPFAVSDWGVRELTGRVAPDAERIWIALAVRGDGDATVDDLSLEVVPPDPAPPSTEADVYLMKAIEIIRNGHIDSARADWPRIVADAREDIAGAKTPEDTYPAIRGVLGALGEKHSFFMPASMVGRNGAGGTGSPPPAEMPTSELVDGRFGVVRLPGLATFGPQGEDVAKRYTATLRTALETMDKAPICGWIVDLRANTGGNMWPMLKGIDPLLGEGPFGAFVTPAGNVTTWQRAQGNIYPAAAKLDPTPSWPLAHAGAPVAVLLSTRTMSSGEMTAVALIGREGVRTFGTQSGGFTTGNSTFPLSDGALLIVTGVFIRDRTGTPYVDFIAPDVQTTPENAQAEAVRWLAARCKARR